MKNDNHRFLITGATGFVGSCIVRELVRRRKKVSVIVRSKALNWRLADIASKIEIYECDILDKSLGKIVDTIRPTVIFHLSVYGASSVEEDINKLIDVNIKGTKNLIQAVKKQNFKLFINTGSSSEYGVKDKKMNEEDICKPINDYGVSKLAATLLCQKIAKTESLPLITFRLFSPFGYYEDKNRLIPSVVLNSLKNNPIKLVSPVNVRDFIFIEDVVQAYLSAIETDIHPGEILNIGSGEQKNVQDVVRLILKITGSKSSILWNAKKRHVRQIEPKIWEADITKSNRMLEWNPKYSLEEGLRKTVLWFKAHKYLYE